MFLNYGCFHGIGFDVIEKILFLCIWINFVGICCLLRRAQGSLETPRDSDYVHFLIVMVTQFVNSKQLSHLSNTFKTTDISY